MGYYEYIYVTILINAKQASRNISAILQSISILRFTTENAAGKNEYFIYSTYNNNHYRRNVYSRIAFSRVTTLLLYENFKNLHLITIKLLNSARTEEGVKY